MATRGRSLPPMDEMTDEQIAADAAKYGSTNPKTGEKVESPRSRATNRPASNTTKTTGAPPLSEIGDSIRGLYNFAGITLSSGVAGPRGAVIGNAISENADKCAAAYIEAARKDPKFAKFLTKAMSGGAYGGLIFAHVPIAMSVYFAMSMPAQINDDTVVEPEPQQPLFRVPGTA